LGDKSPNLVTLVVGSVARFFLVQNTKTGKNIPNDHKIHIPNGHKIFPMAVKRPNGHKTYQDYPLQDPPKFTQIWIFGLKTNHLATLVVVTFMKTIF
jgi:hypothetical protein